MEEEGNGSGDAAEGGGEERETEGGRVDREEPAGGGGEWEKGLLPGSGEDAWIQGCVGGAVSGDDDILDKPHGDTGGDAGT